MAEKICKEVAMVKVIVADGYFHVYINCIETARFKSMTRLMEYLHV